MMWMLILIMEFLIIVYLLLMAFIPILCFNLLTMLPKYLIVMMSLLSKIQDYKSMGLGESFFREWFLKQAHLVIPLGET